MLENIISGIFQSGFDSFAKFCKILLQPFNFLPNKYKLIAYTKNRENSFRFRWIKCQSNSFKILCQLLCCLT